MLFAFFINWVVFQKGIPSLQCDSIDIRLCVDPVQVSGMYFWFQSGGKQTLYA